jgi:hypothetical protein
MPGPKTGSGRSGPGTGDGGAGGGRSGTGIGGGFGSGSGEPGSGLGAGAGGAGMTAARSRELRSSDDMWIPRSSRLSVRPRPSTPTRTSRCGVEIRTIPATQELCQLVISPSARPAHREERPDSGPEHHRCYWGYPVTRPKGEQRGVGKREDCNSRPPKAAAPCIPPQVEASRQLRFDLGEDMTLMLGKHPGHHLHHNQALPTATSYAHLVERRPSTVFPVLDRPKRRGRHRLQRATRPGCNARRG